jgi:type II secretory pathway pseudopilin PulG
MYGLPVGVPVDMSENWAKAGRPARRCKNVSIDRARSVRRTGPCRGYRRGRAGAGLRHPGAEAGFTIVESTFALVLIFGVILGLLHTLTSASKGIVTARQRNVAVGLANQVLEQARGVSYDLVGHGTLSTDTEIVSGQYAGEPLAYASPPAQSPWSPHISTQVVNNSTYATKVYVTTHTPTVAEGGGDAYKRVTAVVDWTGGTSQYAAGSGIKSQIKVSTNVFNAQLPADPLFQGVSTASGGSFGISGTIDNLSITDGTFTLPKTTGDVIHQLVHSARGLAQSASADLATDLSLQASGAGIASDTSGQIPSSKVSSAADNDAGTAEPETSEAETTAASGSIGRVNTLDLIRTANSTALYSRSTALSSAADSWDDDDGLPYTVSDADGPGSFAMPYGVSDIGGSASIGSLITTGATHVRSVIDRDDAGTQKQIATTAMVNHPATSLLTFASSGVTVATASGLPFSGMVLVRATGDVTATANAGNGVGGPGVTTGSSASFEVCLYDSASPPPEEQGTCPLGYERLEVFPGTAGTLTTSTSLTLNGVAATLNATATAGTNAVTSTASGADIERAEAALINWFRVTADLTIAGGTSVAVELDYGQISARSKYCLPTDASCIQTAL